MTGRHRLAVLASVLGLALAPAPALARRAHGGGHHYYYAGPHAGSRVFIGGSFPWDPFFAPYYYPYYTYPYYTPYYLPYPPYFPPPPDDSTWNAPSDEPSSSTGDEARADAPARTDDVPPATYGLVQLRGVPDGAAVDLDGRFWLTADDLAARWLALPAGNHRLEVRPPGAESVTRTITVIPGKTLAVQLGPFPRRRR